MSTFAAAVQNQPARTTNGMVARKSTASACVDLFFKIGASRGKDIIPQFVAAYVEDPDLALRIVNGPEMCAEALANVNCSVRS